MAIRFVNVGFGNMVAENEVVAIISPNSAPVKRLKDDAKKLARFVDVTQGRRTRAIIITNSNHVILSSVQVETLVGRFTAGTQKAQPSALESGTESL